jgi:hypothetical protein
MPPTRQKQGDPDKSALRMDRLDPRATQKDAGRG